MTPAEVTVYATDTAPPRPECEMWTVPQAAVVIGVSPSTLYSLIRAGKLPELRVHRIGRQLKVSKVNLASYLAAVAS